MACGFRAQAQYVRKWVLERCKFEAGFEFVFYPARYDKLFFSISPAQGSSIVDSIPLEKVNDVSRSIKLVQRCSALPWCR